MVSATLEGSAASGVGSLRDPSIHNPGQPASKPCARCGERPRYSTVSYCKECHTVDVRAWRESHREKMTQVARDWRNAHRERCREAQRAYQKRKREQGTSRTPEEQAKAREHAKAHGAIARAIRTGKLKKPTRCSRCGEGVTSRHLAAHHEDYEKRLEVVWLCRYCHKAAHKKQTEPAERSAG